MRPGASGAGHVPTFRLLPPGPAIFEAALTAALYPARAILFVRAHRGVADPDRV